MDVVNKRRLLASALTAMLALCGAEALAGPVSDELRQSLRSRQQHDLVPVIITFTDRVDPAQFRGRDRGRRAALIRALRDKAGRTQGQVTSLLRARGARNLRQLWINNSLAVQVPASAIAELETAPGIASIRTDALLAAPAPAAGSSAPAEWNINAIRAPDLWTLGYSGAGVVVASMDSGVDVDHPDLASSWRGGTNSWYDPNGEHATPYDTLGHGTQTMGIMVGGAAGGSAIGVAPDAQWVAVKIFNDAGFATLSGIHLGFQWLLDPDGDPATADAPDVVNNSWGLQNSGSCNLEFDDDVRALKAAGIAVVFAGGNSGPAALSNESPANNPEGFGVGALDSSSTVASFSSRGPSACDGSFFPELTAPGIDVVTADLSFGGLPLYATVSGSSYAAPHVSGALALLAQAFPAASVAELETALKDYARDLGVVGPDSDYGYGAADVLAAYGALLAGTPPPMNQSPVASPDAFEVQANGVLAVAAPGLLSNDTDADGDLITAVLATPPAGGTLSLNADGSFNYLPNAGTSSDTFTYQANDGQALSAPATVTITVLANQPPSAAPDAHTLPAGAVFNAAAPGVLGNDSDPEGDALTAVLMNPPTGGTLSLNANGSFSYTPSIGTTSDAFSYQASDGTSLSAPVSVSLTVQPNSAPTAANDVAVTRINRAITINVIANDSDPEGALDPATVALATAPRAGTVTVNPNGSVVYSPRLNFYGTDYFGYTVKDKLGAVSNKATVTVRVAR